MADFTITEDFPKNECEFDERFSDPAACYRHLFKQKWPNGFICKKCGHGEYWVSSRNLYVCTQCEHQHLLIAGTIMDAPKSRSPNDSICNLMTTNLVRDVADGDRCKINLRAIYDNFDGICMDSGATVASDVPAFFIRAEQAAYINNRDADRIARLFPNPVPLNSLLL